MHIIIAIILGIVEGLTEFLPVSSTGHLIIAGHALNFTGDRANTFEIFIQLGAILAVIWLYRQRFIDLLNLRKSQGFEGKRGIYLLALTTFPALIGGFLLHDTIDKYLFKPLTVAIGLAVGGIALIVFERFQHKAKTLSLDKLTSGQALGIGLFQLLALWPGVSRSASTIIGGMIKGVDRKTAVEYSFLAAVPVLVAASGFSLLSSLNTLQPSDLPLFAAGFITAFISALLAVKYFVKLVQRYTFTPFGWYRIVLAIVVILTLV